MKRRIVGVVVLSVLLALFCLLIGGQGRTADPADGRFEIVVLNEFKGYGGMWLVFDTQTGNYSLHKTYLNENENWRINTLDCWFETSWETCANRNEKKKEKP